MTTHEYEVRFSLENCFITTLAYVPEEDDDLPIGQAEDRLREDGIDIRALEVLEVKTIKTGEYE
jgi:hypothetical protein